MRIGLGLGLSVGGSAYNPTRTSGLVMWLRGDSVLSSGGLISQATDLSGAGNHATQSTGANKPALTASAQNGQPGITFDGADKWLQTAASALGANTDFTVVCAIKITALPGVAGIMDTAAGPYGNVTLPFDSTGVTYFGTNAATRIVSAAGVLTAAAQVFALTKSGTGTGNLSQRRNGGTALVNTGATAPAPVGAHRIGKYDALSMTGHVLDLALYSRALSAAERQSVERYMGSRYAITVA